MFVKVTKVLLENNANLLEESQDRSTVLHFAARSRSESVVRLVLDKVRSVKQCCGSVAGSVS